MMQLQKLINCVFATANSYNPSTMFLANFVTSFVCFKLGYGTKLITRMEIYCILRNLPIRSLLSARCHIFCGIYQK